MDVTPRLTVTQEQAEVIFDWYMTHRTEPLTLRLPERPTMPCPQVGMEVPDEKCSECDGTGWIPIPEGTRVGVGSWEHGEDTMGFWMKWHPVATATLTEVHAALADGQPYRWYVTLSDIKPVEADHDEPI